MSKNAKKHPLRPAKHLGKGHHPQEHNHQVHGRGMNGYNTVENGRIEEVHRQVSPKVEDIEAVSAPAAEEVAEEASYQEIKPGDLKSFPPSDPEDVRSPEYQPSSTEQEFFSESSGIAAGSGRADQPDSRQRAGIAADDAEKELPQSGAREGQTKLGLVSLPDPPNQENEDYAYFKMKFNLAGGELFCTLFLIPNSEDVGLTFKWRNRDYDQISEYIHKKLPRKLREKAKTPSESRQTLGMAAEQSRRQKIAAAEIAEFRKEKLHSKPRLLKRIECTQLSGQPKITELPGQAAQAPLTLVPRKQWNLIITGELDKKPRPEDLDVVRKFYSLTARTLRKKDHTLAGSRNITSVLKPEQSVYQDTITMHGLEAGEYELRVELAVPFSQITEHKSLDLVVK